MDEHYDEIVYNTLPQSDAARARLLAGSSIEIATPYGECLGSFSGFSDVALIQGARRYILDRKLELHDRLYRARLEAQREKEELRALGIL